jgi:uncharacterized protein (TIGR02246 family)
MNHEILKAIKQANDRAVKAFRRGDTVAYALEYTEDAVLLPPNSEKIQGRKAIEESIRRMLSRPGARDMEFTYDEMFECGETATLVGGYVLRIYLTGQAPFVENGKYVCVWKRTADGWKLHRDIYNSDQPT